MLIRRARRQDAASIRHLILSSVDPEDNPDFNQSGWRNFLVPNSVEAIARRIQDCRYLTLCAEADASVVGVITMRDNYRIWQLFVAPTMRNRGVASALWNSARSIGEAQGNKGYYEVRSSSMALPVYQRFGFRLTGERQVANDIAYYPLCWGNAPDDAPCSELTND